MLIYDCEIINPWPPYDRPRESGIRYCANSSDFDGMGVAVVCAWDCVTKRARVFMRDNLKELRAIADSHDYIVGYNNRRFDNPLLKAAGIFLDPDKTYDLLQEIWRAAGLNPDTFSSRTHGGFRLEQVCAINFDMHKSGDGAQAPILWQRGHVGTVVDYCLNDIALTRRLLNEVMLKGIITNPKNPPHTLRIRKPGEEIARRTLFDL